MDQLNKHHKLSTGDGPSATAMTKDNNNNDILSDDGKCHSSTFGDH